MLKRENFRNKNVFSQKVGAGAGAASTRANKGLFQLGGLRLRYRNDAFKNDNLYWRQGIRWITNLCRLSK